MKVCQFLCIQCIRISQKGVKRAGRVDFPALFSLRLEAEREYNIIPIMLYYQGSITLGKPSLNRDRQYKSMKRMLMLATPLMKYDYRYEYQNRYFGK